MEPVYMILGQACGVAAALAVDGKTSVQTVPYEKLKAKLLAQKAVLDPATVPAPAGGGKLPADKLAGIVVDSSKAMSTGEWKRSTAIGKYVGDGYLHDDNEGKGSKSVRFTPTLPAEGKYEVYFHYTPSSNRATNVPVVVKSKDGEVAKSVDQKKAPSVDGAVSLGTFAFDRGSAGWVEVHTAATNGYVIADAVRFVPR
jgi:hypothetical protein